MPTPTKLLLQQLGLSKPESEVYIASLRLGEATVQEIAHESHLPRTTAASILERLEAQGFVTARQNRGKRKYWIEDPHVLAEKEKARLQVFEQLSGRLHAEYHKADHKPEAEIYDSQESVLNLMAKVVNELEKGDEILVFEAPAAHHYQAVMTDELFHAWSSRKTAKGILTRALIPSGQQNNVRPQSLKHNVSVRVLPQGMNMDMSLWIFGGSVVVFSGTHHYAVRLRHRHTSESFKALFEFLWNQSIAF